MIEETNIESDDQPHHPKNKTRHHLRWGLLAFFLLFLVCFPSACQYQPPLIGIKGFETQLVTDPGYFGGPVKWIQSFFEMTPCTYELFGWDNDNLLYYQSVCYDKVQLWQYIPQKETSHRIDRLPEELHVQIGDRDLLEIVRADGVRPVEYEPSVRKIVLQEPNLVSPDGQFIVILTQRVYSVFDVVVLRFENG